MHFGHFTICFALNDTEKRLKHQVGGNVKHNPDARLNIAHNPVIRITITQNVIFFIRTKHQLTSLLLTKKN